MPQPPDARRRDDDDLDPEGPSPADLARFGGGDDDDDSGGFDCPECGRRLAADAPLCSGCGRFILDDDRTHRRAAAAARPARAPTARRGRRWIVTTAGALLLILAVFWLLRLLP
ncbi:MAG: hypothetical protein IBJ11_10535 [Phycisphaerales bacterium]|nr:hypothetical protein [Phycisphaerales bacterium]